MSDYRPSAAALERELRRMKRKRRRKRGFVGLLITLLISVAIGATLDRQMVMVTVRGTGMAGTLEPGNVVVSVRHMPVARGDIILLAHNSEMLLRRVVAKGGDTVEITSDGQVLVNGQAIDDAFAVGATAAGDQTYPLTVPLGGLFVLGDNREASVDSRSADFGLVAEEEVVGKPQAIIWPAYRIARLNG